MTLILKILVTVARMLPSTAPTVVLAAFISAAHGQMVTPGELKVSDGGAAIYEIKLRTPHGMAGLEPSLSLVYNSQTGNGPLGVGWSLTGLSSIARCSQNQAQDPSPVLRGINFTSSDRYCLDGQRLIAVRDPATSTATIGAYGADATFYATEMESLNRVRSFGATGSGVDWRGESYTGPTSFKVNTKSGLTMDYGFSADSRVMPVGKSVVANWQLNKATDTKGNYMVVAYSAPDAATGQSYPISITYTGNQSVSPVVVPTSKVEFSYESRLDVVPRYAAGSVQKLTMRMAKISMVSAGLLVREYRISYKATSSANDRSVIDSITECAPNGECLAPTNFTWSKPEAGWNAAQWTGGANPGVPIDGQCISADYNGDGMTDIACFTGTAGEWHIMFSTGAGWQSQNWQNGFTPGSPASGNCLSGDFNGDGKSDLACLGLWSSRWNPDPKWQMTFGATGTWSTQSWAGPKPGIPVSGQCLTGDYDGDSRTDLACFTGATGNWHIALSTGSSWALSNWLQGPSPGTPVGAQCFSGDFNGDGLADMACYTGSGGSWHMGLSTGIGWQSPFWTGGPAPGVPIGGQCIPGDYNGDGKTDMACNAGYGYWDVALSTGTGWATAYWAGPSPRSPVTDQCRSGDFDGDGLSDLMCKASGTDWVIASSTGSGFTQATWTGGPTPGTAMGDQCVVGNFSADGKPGLACFSGQGGSWHVASPKPEFNSLITKVDTPLGTVASIDFKTGAQTLNDRLLRSFTPTWPQITTVPSAPLVTDVTLPDGIGGTRSTLHWYDTAVMEPSTGRGFLGFRSHITQDSRTGIKQTTAFRQDFPYIGASDALSTATSTGMPLSSSVSSYACLSPATGLQSACVTAPGNRYFVYVSQATARAWDLNGQAMPGQRTTNDLVDAYGNYGRVTVEALNPDGSASEFKKVTSSDFYNDPANWIIGRVRSATVASSGPDVPAPVIPGSGALPATPAPTLPATQMAKILPVILQLLLED